MPVLLHGEKGLCLDLRFKGSVSSYIERLVQKRRLIENFCPF